MSVAIITGSLGLIGSESVKFFSDKGYDVVGIDNDMRSYFFGKDASTIKSLDYLKNKYANYVHFNYDIRQCDEIKKIFHKYNSSIEVIIHAAAQPSHDWAANEPITDFAINASATINLLELMRNYCSESVFGIERQPKLVVQLLSAIL